MNILFTCAGRRNYLIKYFKSALKDIGGNVIAVDSDEFAPALFDADQTYKVPSVYDSSYKDALLEVCAVEQVDMLISLNDLELPVLTEYKEEFSKQSVTLLVSNTDVIDMCADKLKTYRFLKENGFDSPATYSDLEQVKQMLNSNEIKFPLMVKPRWGSASIGLSPVHSIAELERSHISTQDTVSRGSLDLLSIDDGEGTVIIQEFIKGDEYGLDVLNDLNCEYICVYAKKKRGMRAGETDKAELVDDKRLLAVGEMLGKKVAHMGNLDADLFVAEDRVLVLELNPRFGGGYPFSHELGARYPEAIIAWYTNSKFDHLAQDRILNTVVAKCDRLISRTFN